MCHGAARLSPARRAGYAAIVSDPRRYPASEAAQLPATPGWLIRCNCTELVYHVQSLGGKSALLAAILSLGEISNDPIPATANGNVLEA